MLPEPLFPLWEQGVGGSNPLAPTSLRSNGVGARQRRVKQSSFGGLCAFGAFKSSRPDQSSLGAKRRAEAAAAQSVPHDHIHRA